jgi:hypothetical protein
MTILVALLMAAATLVYPVYLDIKKHNKNNILEKSHREVLKLFSNFINFKRFNININFGVFSLASKALSVSFFFIILSVATIVISLLNTNNQFNDSKYLISLSKITMVFSGEESLEPTIKSNPYQTPKYIIDPTEILARMNRRSPIINSLKREGKIVMSQHGLWNQVLGEYLSPSDLSLIDQENEDHRNLFTLVAETSNPKRSYDEVANDYAKNIWKEWPPRR